MFDRCNKLRNNLGKVSRRWSRSISDGCWRRPK